jgi:hypothetical protein
VQEHLTATTLVKCHGYKQTQGLQRINCTLLLKKLPRNGGWKVGGLSGTEGRAHPRSFGRVTSTLSFLQVVTAHYPVPICKKYTATSSKRATFHRRTCTPHHRKHATSTPGTTQIVQTPSGDPWTQDGWEPTVPANWAGLQKYARQRKKTRLC